MTSPAKPRGLAIVGAGALGRALAGAVRAEGRRVLIGSAKGLEGTVPMREACAESRLVVLAVPPEWARDALSKLAPHLDGSHLVLHTARGLDPGTRRRITDVVREETAAIRVGVLAGPLRARELARGEPTAAVVGSRFPDLIEEAKQQLGGARLRVYGNPDAVGVELAAALGLTLRLVEGLATGLGFGPATRAVALTRGLAELARLGARLGGKERTFMGLAGVGTLLSDAAGPIDEDVAFGETVGRGEPRLRGAEPPSALAARAAAALATESATRAPLLQSLRALLDGQLQPADLQRALMERAFADE